jgi:hypothetical protein
MKGTMRIVDILVAIDCDQIVEDYKNQDDAHKRSTDPAKPTQLADSKKYIYMITKSSDVLSGNAGDALNVRVNLGDIIRWRETSLTNDFDYSAVFTQFIALPSSTGRITAPAPVGGVSGDEVFAKKEPEPIQGTAPWKASMQLTPYHYWQCSTERPGTVTYHWVFQILDTKGQSLGYFAWDPWITIAE